MRQDGIKYHEASDRHKRAISTELLSNTIKYRHYLIQKPNLFPSPHLPYMPYRTWARLYISATVGPAFSWTGTTSAIFCHVWHLCDIFYMIIRIFFQKNSILWQFRTFLTMYFPKHVTYLCTMYWRINWWHEISLVRQTNYLFRASGLRRRL
jgi:hypothetical protein